MKYRKKPVVIEAIQYKGDNAKEIIEKFGNNFVERSTYLLVKTLEGNMIADKGDYIIQGIKGECYPCKPDIFLETYEVVE